MIKDNVDKILKEVPKNVTIVAATKYVGIKEMRELLDVGINNFGENRVDSFLKKFEELKEDNIVWHFIGHLQTNKAKKIIDKIDYFHSLDSLKLLKIIEKYRTTKLNVFLEINLLNQENKNGIKLTDIECFINEIKKAHMVNLVGLMMIGSPKRNLSETKKDFLNLYLLKEELNKKYNLNMNYLSMGMSADYHEAISSKATHIRLGRVLFQ